MRNGIDMSMGDSHGALGTREEAGGGWRAQPDLLGEVTPVEVFSR
jgi:hypothetical protein